MTKTRVIGSTDVYGRKHLDRQFDRLERLRVADKERIKKLESDLVMIKDFLRLGPHSAVFRAFEEKKA